MYLSVFLAVYGGRTVPIAVDPLWSEADIGINIFKSLLGYPIVQPGPGTSALDIHQYQFCLSF